MSEFPCKSGTEPVNGHGRRRAVQLSEGVDVGALSTSKSAHVVGQACRESHPAHGAAVNAVHILRELRTR